MSFQIFFQSSLETSTSEDRGEKELYPKCLLLIELCKIILLDSPRRKSAYSWRQTCSARSSTLLSPSHDFLSDLIGNVLPLKVPVRVSVESASWVGRSVGSVSIFYSGKFRLCRFLILGDTLLYYTTAYSTPAYVARCVKKSQVSFGKDVCLRLRFLTG